MTWTSWVSKRRWFNSIDSRAPSNQRRNFVKDNASSLSHVRFFFPRNQSNQLHKLFCRSMLNWISESSLCHLTLFDRSCHQARKWARTPSTLKGTVHAEITKVILVNVTEFTRRHIANSQCLWPSYPWKGWQAQLFLLRAPFPNSSPELPVDQNGLRQNPPPKLSSSTSQWLFHLRRVNQPCANWLSRKAKVPNAFLAIHKAADDGDRRQEVLWKPFLYGFMAFVQSKFRYLRRAP